MLTKERIETIKEKAESHLTHHLESFFCGDISELCKMALMYIDSLNEKKEE